MSSQRSLGRTISRRRLRGRGVDRYCQVSNALHFRRLQSGCVALRIADALSRSEPVREIIVMHASYAHLVGDDAS